jgi:hypothetical protein
VKMFACSDAHVVATGTNFFNGEIRSIAGLGLVKPERCIQYVGTDPLT